MSGIHIVVMGVAGCGKSQFGERIAHALGVPLIEGDAFHPPDNIRKMRSGEALSDADRAGWLRTLAAELARHPDGCVLTCSALKASYRETLRSAVPRLRFAHLAITQQESLRRVATRADHFYPPSLVASQFQALEDPSGEKGVLTLDGAMPLDTLVARTRDWLRP
jgi:gluconokinase